MSRVVTLDTSLRDGAQAEGVSFSVLDKLEIIRVLDEIGVDYIEAGQPSNPKDRELFALRPPTRFSKLTAFGPTARKDTLPQEDEGIRELLSVQTPAVTVFGKASLLHVTDVLCCSGEENLRLIEQSCSFLRAGGREVLFDAEHFFDGYLLNRDYALECLRAAARGGASLLVLCDTNGGRFPDEVYAVVRDVRACLDTPLGIHAHNDTGMADANTMLAVEAGAGHVQGTLCGFGERCGNANLATVMAGLSGKRGKTLSCDLSSLTRAVRTVAEIANVSLKSNLPYVGRSAFAHKAGMHIDAMRKNPATFEHISPEVFGNDRRFLTSELSGRNQVLPFVRAILPDAGKNAPEVAALAGLLKEREKLGYAYEGAEASFELLVRRELGVYKPLFELVYFRTFSEQFGMNEGKATALIKLRVGAESALSAGEGDGPVHALDSALRGALKPFYPQVGAIRLIDYKVRVLNPRDATASQVRVLITSTDGGRVWSTVGVSADIIQASWQALSDSVEFYCLEERRRGGEEKTS